MEHPDDSQGPYHYGWSGVRAILTAHLGAEWPDPRDEGHKIRAGSPEVCGCVTSARLHDWFAGWWGELDGAGFTVRVFDTPTDDCTVLPSGQVVFMRDRARVVYSCTPARFVNVVERRLVGVSS